MQNSSKYSLARWRPIAIDDLVRLGRSGDGGYVISRRSVDATELLIGLGIFDDWSFESAFRDARPAVKIVGVDGSVSARTFRRKAVEATVLGVAAAIALRRSYMRTQLSLARRWRRAARQFERFFGQQSTDFVQKFLTDEDSESSVTWASLRKEVAWPRDSSSPTVFIKMDIEGSEYRALYDVLADAASISGMVIEFHEADVHWERFAELMDALQDKLAVVHIHGNNYAPLIRGSNCPQALEVSLVNRDLLTGPPIPSARSYPLRMLDEPCNPEKPDYAVPV